MKCDIYGQIVALVDIRVASTTVKTRDSQFVDEAKYEIEGRRLNISL